MEKVLVVEDDSPLCWLLETIMRNQYEVTVVNNGLDAWSLLSERNIPDVIISDLAMPGLDGIELLENLSESGLFRNIPVIILSGDEDPAKRKRCLELGAFSYVIKPFEPRLLLDEVNSALSSRKANLIVK
jgi:two-component system chemotaxis response regulator CheY